MKVTALIFSLFFSIAIFAKSDNELTVQQDGLVVEVVDFEEGDKLKLFEVETGEHILSKSYARIDLSQLPVGSYLLENNEGKSIVIDRLEEELSIDGAVVAVEEDFVLENDAQVASADTQEVIVGNDFIENYVNPTNELDIAREGDIITVVEFEEGDTLKLFEVKDTIHVLSKTTNVVDLSQLPAGLYVLESDNGKSVVIEKFIETENTLTEL